MKHVLFAFLIVVVTIASAQPRREINKSVELKSNGRLVLDTYKGSVKITTWDKPIVEIKAVIEPDPDIFGNDDAKLELTNVRISSSDGEVRIKSDYDKLTKGDWDWFKLGETNAGNLPLIHYTIIMPKTASLRIKDYKSNSSVRDLASELDFNTYKGDAEIVALDGSVELETYKGNVKLSFAKLGDASKFDTYKGSITINIPKETAFNIETDFEKHVEFDSEFDIAYKSKSTKRHDYDFRGTDL